MKKRFLRISVYLLASLAIIFAVSFAQAGDSTSFNPTAVTVKVDAISGVPVGAVIPWPSSTPPKDYLVCNGQTFSATTYPKLQAVLGSTAVPDYRDEFLRGAGTGRTIGSKQGDAIRNITASMWTPVVRDNPGVRSGSGAFRTHSWGGGIGPQAEYEAWGRMDKVTFDASRSVPTADENRPSNVAVLYIIRAK